MVGRQKPVLRDLLCQTALATALHWELSLPEQRKTIHPCSRPVDLMNFSLLNIYSRSGKFSDLLLYLFKITG